MSCVFVPSSAKWSADFVVIRSPDDFHLHLRDGDDKLEGKDGRDLLIGGAGEDAIKGDEGEDILIGGTTTYDDDFAALGLISNAWTSFDRDYLERIENLRSGAGPILGGTGIMLSASATVFDDGVRDKLEGKDGFDWLFADFDGIDDDDDELKGLKAGEVVDSV